MLKVEGLSYSVKDGLKDLDYFLGDKFREIYPQAQNPLSYTPMTHLVDLYTQGSANKTKPQWITYPARLIDSVISVIMFAVLQVYNHFYGLYQQYNEDKRIFAVKVILTPVTLPARIGGAILLYGPFLIARFACNVLGYNTGNDVFTKLDPPRYEVRIITWQDDFHEYSTLKSKISLSLKYREEWGAGIIEQYKDTAQILWKQVFA